ncbi:hypothetical protein BD779DRAFT_1553497 [Infundibulicybe gibba]|nr:hypothetical protein BD779DRAFT_1553497 [Infundibulicybe gibba]
MEPRLVNQIAGNGRTSAWSPISILPPELLSEVFIRYLDLPRTSPYLLSTISRHWRDVSTHTPTLWRVVPRVNLDASLPLPPMFMTHLGAHLQRSRDTPIALTLFNVTAKSNPCLVKLFLAHAHRWEHLAIHFHAAAHVALACLAPARGRLHSLKSLELWLDSVGDAPPIITDTFEFAPRLRSVVLESEAQLQSIPLPWEQITHFTGTCLDVLHLAPQLSTCALQINSISSDNPTPNFPAPHTHDNLRTFQIAGILPTGLVVLDKLTLPALTSFTLGSCPPDIPVAPLTALISRSGCSLKSLDIRVCAQPEEFSVDTFLPPNSTNSGSYLQIHLLPKLNTLTLHVPPFPAPNRSQLCKLKSTLASINRARPALNRDLDVRVLFPPGCIAPDLHMWPDSRTATKPPPDPLTMRTQITHRGGELILKAWEDLYSALAAIRALRHTMHTLHLYVAFMCADMIQAIGSLIRGRW